MPSASVPETAKQACKTRDPREWTWVEPSVWTERMLAALGNGVKGGQWYSLWDKVCDRGTLAASWEGVARNRGAAGGDGVSIERFAAHAERYLDELVAELQAGRHRPSAVRRMYIPKSGGGKRPLGIPTVKDRIVQGALKRVLEPIFEWEFRPESYGFRPGRGAKDALREVDAALKAGRHWVVDADLKGYFDNIPHDALMEEVQARISDGRVLALIDAYLKADILDGLEQWTPTGGTPQGAVISPLLANLYLHGLDCRMSERGYRIVRYADDFVILCRDETEARAALHEVQTWCAARRLTLHPDKTHIGDCRRSGEGFEFLGYRFEGGRRWVRKKSRNALKDKIRAKTRRNRGASLAAIIADLNPMLRGWFGYFKHAYRTEFPSIDGFVRRRLRAILRRHQHRASRLGHSRQDHQRWTNAFFAAQGLFTLTTAHALASQSRCGNN
jgi:RNA-directed DNA polymerase